MQALDVVGGGKGWIDGDIGHGRAYQFEDPDGHRPAKYNITQAFYLYIFEPGGNCVEIYSSGYLIFAPDWEPIILQKTNRGRGVYWGNTFPESFKTYGTPVVDVSMVSKEDLFVFDPA